MTMRLIKALLLCLICCSSSALAQWNDGYWPEVGVSGVIDTIYGWKNQQDLGTGMINVGPRPGESYGRVWFTGLDGEPGIINKAYYYELAGGPTLQAKKIPQSSNKLGIKLEFRNYFAPIASRNSRDRLILGGANVPTIYWEEANGDYDSANTTRLIAPRSPTLEYYNYYGNLLYHTYLTSDTVEDIVSVVIRGYQNEKPDSLFAVLYKGGAALKGQKEVLPDEIVSMGEYDPGAGWSRSMKQGDWRGVGREDLISSDQLAKAYFYYRNDKPFSLSEFVVSLNRDTLLSMQDSDRHDVSGTLGLLENALSMKAYPKSPDDQSQDLVLATYEDLVGRYIRFFRGHKDFGKSRLTFDSAQLTIPPLRGAFDGFAFNNNLKDLGDMTGTGNRVFYAGASQDGGFYSCHLFYVMGEAMDDTADMAYFVEPYGSAWVDTITANGDNMQDVILGIPEYYSKKDLDRGKTGVGTIHLLYGTDKIPVKGKSIVSVSQKEFSFAIYPNPTTGPLTIQLAEIHSESSVLSITDILGRNVYRRDIPTYASFQQLSLDLGMLNEGTYILALSSGSNTARATLRILPH